MSAVLILRALLMLSSEISRKQVVPGALGTVWYSPVETHHRGDAGSSCLLPILAVM